MEIYCGGGSSVIAGGSEMETGAGDQPPLIRYLSDDLTSEVQLLLTTVDSSLDGGRSGVRLCRSNGSTDRPDIGGHVAGRSTLRYNVVHLFGTSVVLGVIILATIVGNVFVIAAIVLERNLQNVANYLIASLAVADLVCVVGCR